jgi:hypothetical protein
MIVAFGGFGKAAMVLSSIYILGIICAAVPAGDQRQAVAGLIVTTATRAILRFRAADNRGAEPSCCMAVSNWNAVQTRPAK